MSHGTCDRARARAHAHATPMRTSTICARRYGVCARTVEVPSGVTRLTVNICAATRGATTLEAASLEPEKAKVEAATKYSMVAIALR